MNKSLAALLLVALPACDGFKEAMTAHADTAARAGSQELSVERLADLLAKSKVPLKKEVAQSLADVWVNYQLIGMAGAAGDSLSDPKVIDEAMWPAYTQARTRKFYDIVSKGWASDDTTGMTEAYARGDFLSARHILFPVQGPPPAAGTDTMRTKAEAVLRQVNAANFAQLAQKHGSDGTAPRGGDLGVFTKGQMVPEFERAVASLKPGEIGPLVQTQFGYHIIRRSTFAEVEGQLAEPYKARKRTLGDSLYLANLETKAKVEVKPDAPKLLKGLATDFEGKRNDKAVLASYVGGSFTVARMAKWLAGFPNPDQIRGQIAQAPDSVVPLFVRNFVRNDLLLNQADSAKVQVDSTERAEIRRAFVALVTNTWTGLRVSPALLADSAKTTTEKERLAASRIEKYVDRLLGQEEQYIEIPAPLASALHEKFEWKINSAGLDKALESATKIRAKADSARTTNQPPSAVPLPGAPAAPSVPDTSRKP